MSAIQHIVTEIKGVRQFFQARGDAGPAGDTQLQRSLSDSVLHMINGLTSISPSDASQLHAAVADNPYGDETKRVKVAIDEKVKSVTASASNTAITTGGQFLKCVWNYATKNQMDYLLAPKNPWAGKMTIAVEICNNVGCTHPNEQTVKWTLAMLLCVHYTELPPALILFRPWQIVEL